MSILLMRMFLSSVETGLSLLKYACVAECIRLQKRAYYHEFGLIVTTINRMMFEKK